MLSRLAVIVVLLIVPACSADLGLDAVPETSSSSLPIVNGEPTTDYPTTGILLAGGNPASMVCSGTLIGCDRFLTASHCVCFGDGPDCQNTVPDEPLYVYLQHAGFFSVVRQHVHPQFSFPDNDVAVLELSRPAVGLLPTPIQRTAVGLGTGAVIVGYGRSGGGQEDYGIKQFGPVTTASCPDDASGPGHICWNFDGDGANTCNGDSGGPLFVGEGPSFAVAGITSGGTRFDCLAGDQSYDNAVASFVNYVVAQAGGEDKLGQTSCGALPSVGSPDAAVSEQQGFLSAGQTAALEIPVPAGTTELRIGLNATEGADMNLFVRSGMPPTEIENDCASEGASSYAYCELPSPAEGAWHVLVTSEGSGAYQLAVTVLGGGPVPADDAYDAEGGALLEVLAADGVLTNDAAGAAATLTAELVTAPTHGELTLQPDGSFTYQPAADYVGTDSFAYRATDGTYNGNADVALTISAAPPPDGDGGDEGDGGDDTSGDGGGDDDDDGGCAAGGRGTWTGALLLLGLALTLRPRRRSGR